MPLVRSADPAIWTLLVAFCPPLMGNMAELDPLATLVHRVNNLLAVIHTQIEVAEARATQEAALAALQSIRPAAETTEDTVRRVRCSQVGGSNAGLIGGAVEGSAEGSG